MLTFQERGPGSSIAKTENYKNKNISNKKYHCVFKNRGITCTTPVPSRKLAISLRLKIVFLSQEKTKSQQHPKGFPGGPPPQYWPGLSPLNFRVRMGSGVFDEVWPLATTNSQTSIALNPIKTRLYNFWSKAHTVAPERIIWPAYIDFEALELLYKHLLIIHECPQNMP